MIKPKVELDAKPLGIRMSSMSKFYQEKYLGIMREGARDVAEGIVRHSYPAPGNDPLAGQGNTAAARKQGEENVRGEITSMFIPMDRYSLSAFIKQRNEVVFMMANPIEWRSDVMKRAWQSRDMDKLYESFKKNDFVNSESEPPDVPYVETPTIGVQQSMMKNGRWDGKSSVLVRNRRVVEAFVAQRLKSVGKSVNGWVDICKQLKGNVMKVMQGKGYGVAKLTKVQDGEVYVLKNPNGNPNGMMDKSIQKVLQEEQPSFRAKVDAFIKGMIAAGGKKR